MRITELIVGAIVLTASIFGYQNSGVIVGKIQDMIKYTTAAFFPNIASENQQQYLLQMGYPSVDSMTKITQIGFIATIVIGAVLLCIGLVAKRRVEKPLQNVTVETKFIPDTIESIKSDKTPNAKGLSILKERLARGEITEREFDKLRKFLEQ